jgi:hypothetical protein
MAKNPDSSPILGLLSGRYPDSVPSSDQCSVIPSEARNLSSIDERRKSDPAKTTRGLCPFQAKLCFL